MTVNPESFPNKGVEEFFGDTLVLKLNLEHNGELGFRAILDYIIGVAYAGKYTHLFYVAGDGTFEYVGGDMVDENGVAIFSFTHASDYIVAVTDMEYTGQKLNTNAEKPASESTYQAGPGNDGATDGSKDTAEENTFTEASKAEPDSKLESSEMQTTDTGNTATDKTNVALSVAVKNNGIIFVMGIGVLIAVIIVVIAFAKKKKKSGKA